MSDREEEQGDHHRGHDDPDDHAGDTRSGGSRGDGRRRGPAAPAADRALREARAADRRPAGDRHAAARAPRGRDRADHGRHGPSRGAGRGAARRLRRALRARSPSRTARRTRSGAAWTAYRRSFSARTPCSPPGTLRVSPQTPGHAIAGRREPPPSPPHRYALRIEDGRITKVLDDDPANRLAAAPLWRLGEEFDRGAARRPRRSPVRAGRGVSVLDRRGTRSSTASRSARPAT